MSYLNVSRLIQIENSGWVETFFDLGKRLLATRRVQSRSRGTRTIPYTHCGCVCVRIREHQHRERMSSGVVFWTGSDRDVVVIVRQNERMQEFDGGRRPTKGHSWIKGEMNSQNIQELDERMRTERRKGTVGQKRMILPFYSTILQGDCHFVEEFFNFERRSNNDPPNVEQRYLEVVVSRVSWRARERILQDLDKAATCHQDSLLTVIL